jgi:hypothetical protein
MQVPVLLIRISESNPRSSGVDTKQDLSIAEFTTRLIS